MAARQDPARASGVASLGLVVPDADEVFLVDATPDITAQLAMLDGPREAPNGRVDRAPVDGVFLTHAHMGHYLGLAHLGFEAVSTREVPVWGTERMVKFLKTHAPWQQLVRLGNITPLPVRDGKPVPITARVRVIPYQVPHRAEYTDTVAYVFEGPDRRVLYLPDCHPWHRWPTAMEKLLADVDVALLDGTFFSGDELPGRDLSKIGHPLMVDTMDRLQARVDAGELQVYFIHLNHSNPALDPDSEARRMAESRGFFVARDGLDISL
jgi:pyrroloquinoline quinone biosynthesis protein B